MAERRIESTAVESVMEQAERAHESEKRSGHSRLAQVSGGESLVQLSGLRALNKAAGEASLFHRAAEQSLALAATHRDSAGVNHAVAMENSGDKFDSSSEPDADGGFGGVRNSEFADEKGDGLPYNLELEKDAVFESATAGMAMEVAHPEWEDSVEDATRIAVDAAIRAHEYTGAKGLQDVEEAAVEGATQSAKEMELRADEEHNPDRAYAMRAIAQRVENAAVKSAILAADAVADAHTPHAHKAVLVRPLATAQPVAVVRPLLGGAPAASYSAGPGVVAAGGAGTGAQFVPDATQSVPGMVTGTVYMPPSV
ncbi:hypothetical protein T484DRAFT_3390378 [Baffinella frigidus]|nr:hypothetical protein T484DRAFT_3390378 [Cryptophyta sp. CCMP2293]